MRSAARRLLRPTGWISFRREGARRSSFHGIRDHSWDWRNVLGPNRSEHLSLQRNKRRAAFAPAAQCATLVAPYGRLDADSWLSCIRDRGNLVGDGMTICWEIPKGTETVLQVWRLVDGENKKDVMRERVLANGNIVRETWDDLSHSWRSIWWIENTQQGTSGGTTGVPHMGDAEWFYHTPPDGGYWAEYRRGGSADDPEPAAQSIGIGWHGYDEKTDSMFIGCENNHSLAFLTSENLGFNEYSNQARCRLKITPLPRPAGEPYRARVQVDHAILIVNAPDDDQAVLLTEPQGNDRLRIRRVGNTIEIEGLNGLKPVLK
jgi:hypothetical protein